MNSAIKVKRKRVFVVCNVTFDSRAEADAYIEEHPYEYGGCRYSHKHSVIWRIERDRTGEIDQAMHDCCGRGVHRYTGNFGSRHDLPDVLGNSAFLKTALQIAEKYDKIMEPYLEKEKEDDE